MLEIPYVGSIITYSSLLKPKNLLCSIINVQIILNPEACKIPVLSQMNTSARFEQLPPSVYYQRARLV